jgi:hypothetical protein
MSFDLPNPAPRHFLSHCIFERIVSGNPDQSNAVAAAPSLSFFGRHAADLDRREKMLKDGHGILRNKNAA